MIAHEELLEVMRDRRSIRRFKPDQIPKETLDRLIEAATWAPSASNRQDWNFTVISSPEVREEMAKAVREGWGELLSKNDLGFVTDEFRSYTGNFAWFAGAPVVIVVSVRSPELFMKSLCGERASDIAGARTSASMAAQNLILMAHVIGLGTCCLTGPLLAQERLKEILDMGMRRDIVCLIAVGVPDETPSVPARKTIDEVARYIE